MNSKILTLENKADWSCLLERIPNSDIYFSPEYYEIYENNSEGKAQCYVFEHNNEIALYPFLLHKINEFGYELGADFYDITGVYGYNGVLSSSFDSEFIQKFYDEFKDYCSDNNIIAEFTRFHPLLENWKFSVNNMEVEFNRKTVFVDLTKTYNEINGQYSRKIRRVLNSAAAQLRTEVFINDYPLKDVFIDIYYENMRRVGSDEYLFFNKEYFYNCFNTLPVVQFVIFKDETPVASSITFYWNKFLHGHLGASRSEFLVTGATPMLYDTRIRYGVENGFQLIHFGGGRSANPDDSLLAFKMKFSSTTGDFYIGKKIHNEKIYSIICNQWADKYPGLLNKHGDKFLKYKFRN